MDNLPPHTMASIAPMIHAVSASIINLSPYFPDFNPIDYGGHNLSLSCVSFLQLPQKCLYDFFYFI
jgi:hypothetical protein